MDDASLADQGLRDLPADFLAAPFWYAHDLTYKLDPHQIEVDCLFEEWNARRCTPAYEESVIALGATLDDVWVEEIGRRFGKTAKWIIKLTMIALARPGAVLLYGTAYQKDIAEIIVPLAELLLADGPDDLRPRYKTAKAGQNEGLYFPNGSVIRLAGLDEHPNAFRGRFSDGIVLSEAGFMKGLERLLRAVLLPQFQRRPWAFLVLESSTSEQLDHDFLTVCVPDAKLRDAYVMRTIDDNTVISDYEKRKAIRQSGGRGSPNCEREYYCVQTRDPEGLVIPEFNQLLHVQQVDKPAYSYALVGADPGFQDLFGEVWAYWDFELARLVVCHSWAKRNASANEIAAVNAAVEMRLYGAQVPELMSDIPLLTEGKYVGWTDLLKATPYSAMARRLFESARAKPRQRRAWEINHPTAQDVYWDGEAFQQNPYRRVSDIELRLMADLSTNFGYLFAPTAKDDKEAQINVVRGLLSSGKMVFTPDAGPVIDHVRYAQWNEKRTDWTRHKTHGHYDCLSALIYLCRALAGCRNRRPFPPKYTDPRAPQVATWYQPPLVNEEVRGLVEAFSDMPKWR